MVLTAKAGVLKVETLNVRGMARNRHLALSVADAGMSRLVTFCRYKADWRGRRVVDLDPWFPGSQTCSACGALRPEMQLSRRENASLNLRTTSDRPSTIRSVSNRRSWRRFTNANPDGAPNRSVSRRGA